MKRVTRTSFITAALAALIMSAPVLGQDQQQQPQPSAPGGGPSPAPAAQAQTATGQLVRVDSAAQTLVIRSAQGAQMQFRYNEQTKVTGADQTVAGLATMAGAQVTVRYTKDKQDNLATEIEVQKKS